MGLKGHFVRGKFKSGVLFSILAIISAVYAGNDIFLGNKGQGEVSLY